MVDTNEVLNWNKLVQTMDGRAASIREDRVAQDSIRFVGTYEAPQLEVGAKEFSLTPLVLNQFAKLAKIPLPIFERIMATDPTTGRTVINGLFAEKNEGGGFLIRFIDRTVVTLLDARVTPIDHKEILPVLDDVLMLANNGDDVNLKVHREWFDESDGSWALELLTNDSKPMYSAQPEVGDVVNFGLMINSSDLTGYAPSARVFTLRLSCTNGMTIAHPEDYGNRALSLRTLALGKAKGLEAFRFQVTESMNLFPTIERQMQRSIERIVQKPKDVVAAIFQEYNVPEYLHGGVLKEFADLNGGSISMWDFSNRVTRAARNLEGEDKTTLQALGGRVLSLPLHLLKVGEEPPRRRFKFLTFAETVASVPDPTSTDGDPSLN